MWRADRIQSNGAMTTGSLVSSTMRPGAWTNVSTRKSTPRPARTQRPSGSGQGATEAVAVSALRTRTAGSASSDGHRPTLPSRLDRGDRAIASNSRTTPSHPKVRRMLRPAADMRPRRLAVLGEPDPPLGELRLRVDQDPGHAVDDGVAYAGDAESDRRRPDRGGLDDDDPPPLVMRRVDQGPGLAEQAPLLLLVDPAGELHAVAGELSE